MANAHNALDVSLTKTGFVAGIWHGQLLGHDTEVAPEVFVSLSANPLEGVIVEKATNDAWSVTFPIPAELLSDGIHTFVFGDVEGNILDSFTIVAGDAMADDIRAELNLLRAELDMMKRAFRRHCLETADP